MLRETSRLRPDLLGGPPSIRRSSETSGYYWVAVKELKLSYPNSKTTLFAIYPHSHCGNLNEVP